MNFRIELDVTGWHATEKDGYWQTVACDEMKVLLTAVQEPFPAASDLDQVREFFRRFVGRRNAALISCDPAPASHPPMYRMVYKYPAGWAQAVTFEASLALPVENGCLELLITASEDNFTGVREAMVLKDFMENAGISEREQLARNVIPIEWKFERYHPGKRGSWAYVVSDDEQYDAGYPRHPLTRVRRWLRRIEKTYRVIMIEEPPETPAAPSPAKTSGSGGLLGKLRKALGPKEPTTLGLGLAAEEKRPQNRVHISALPLKPMTVDVMMTELGFDVTTDAVTAEALKKTTMSYPALAERQKIYRDQRDAELKKIMDNEAKVQSIREAGRKMAAELTPDSATLILARIRASGHWLIQPEGGRLALTAFQSMAFFDDYTETTELPSEPVVVTIRELFSLLGQLRVLGIDSLTIDRCPRCKDERGSYNIDELPDADRLLLMYGAHVAGRKYFVDERLQAAMQETDAQKRMEILQHIIEHLNPGSFDTRKEIAKLAIANRDSILYEQCRRHVARYAPDEMASLPEMPANERAQQ